MGFEIPDITTRSPFPGKAIVIGAIMRNIRTAASLLLTLTLISGAWHATETRLVARAQSAESAEAISAARIHDHVRHLASEELQGRRAGTPAADEAARYIAGEFKKYGLKPGHSAGYLQAFNFIARVELGKSNRFEMKDASGAKRLSVRHDYVPLAFSPSVPAEGPVVFAGYGISAPQFDYDNYAGVDVNGKIVMILRGSPDGANPHGRFAEFTMPGLEIQNKTLKAREKGAAGVVFVSSEVSFGSDRLATLRHDLNFLDSGIPTVVISQQAAESMLGKRTIVELENNFNGKAAPLPLDATVAFQTDVVQIEGSASNVVGMIQGSDPRLASEYVVIGAHYDHLGLGGSESLAQNPVGSIHHGADDNASGTSALLELARVMSAGRQHLRRSIVFVAFSAEELGLLGSAAYTKNPAVPLSSTVAMINMDMVGRLRDGKLFVGGVGTSPEWKPLLERLNSSPQPAASVATDSTRFTLSFGQDGYGPSDHQSFYVRDVPVLFFFTGTHDDYHKPSDTADKVNADGTALIAGLVREAATAVANDDKRIAFNRVRTETRPVGRGFRVYLGTIPNYSDQDEGLKLDGVRAGSPAEKAGLRQGDIVTRLGKFPIKNVYDYTYALGEMTAGDEVDVVILRDGKQMALKLTPDKRQ